MHIYIYTHNINDSSHYINTIHISISLSIYVYIYICIHVSLRFFSAILSLV